MSREAFPSDPALPQLTIASDPGLMREIFRRHLRPLTAKGYDIRECVLSRVRYRRPARCVLQYTPRLGEPRTGHERSRWVSGLLYGEDRAAAISQRLRAGDPGQDIPKAFLTFEPVSFIPDLEMLVQVFPYDRRLPLHYAGASLKVAAGFFRRQEPRWPETIAALVRGARGSLTGDIW